MMSQPPHSHPAPLPIVKGSWEDILLQAQQRAGQEDDGAIPLYAKIVDRLSRLPAAQLNAADHRLRSLLVEAAHGFSSYLIVRDRYAEALAVHAQVRPLLLNPAEHDLWDVESAMIQIEAGQIEEGFAAFAEVARKQTMLSFLADLMQIMFDHRRLDLAAKTLAEAEAHVERRFAQDYKSQDARTERALLALMKARLALAHGNPVEATAWYEHACSLSAFYAENPHYFYAALVQYGAFAQAEPVIRRDHNLERAAFWRGVANWRKGDQAKAEAEFLKVIEWDHDQEDAAEDDDDDGDDPISYWEIALANYYLGDRTGLGLALSLNLITETEAPSWQVYFLAGLGWAQRSNVVAARADFHIARRLHKANLNGRKLPHYVWLFCADLIPEPREEYLEYFDNAPL